MEAEILRLVELFRTGKAEAEEAFERIVSLYEKRVYNFVYRHVGAQRAEDVTQEVFLELYKSLSGFERRSKFSTWLFGIAYRVCLQHMQQKNIVVSLDEETMSRNVRSLPSQFHRKEKVELAEALDRALRKLAVPFRTALLLCTVEGMTYQEIAEVLRCPVGTVRSRIHLAKLKLHELLNQEESI